MARVVHAVDVEIKGELDPSLARAVNMTEAEFKRLQSAATTFNSLMSKMQANMPREALSASNQINNALSKVESKSTEATRRVTENMRKIGEEAKKSAEKITRSLAGAFDRVMEGAMHLTGIGGILGGIGGAIAGEEFVRGAFETRAEREPLQKQLGAILRNVGRPDQGAAIDTMIRNMEGRETPVRYEPLLETANLMLAAAPQRFQSVDAVHKMLGQLADVARTPESFKMVSSAFTKILAEGKVDAQHLNEMSIDTGFAFRKAMADALKVTPEQLSEMLKKHKLSGEQQIAGLMKAFDEITGPGGPAYKHAEAQLEGLAGLQERFIGHWRDFQESFGMQLENFLQPIADKIFSFLTPAALTHAFDGLTTFTKAFGTAISSLVDKLQHGNAARQIQAIGDAFGSMFSKLFGGADFTKFYKEVQDPVSGIHSVLTETGKYWIDNISTKWADSIGKTLETIRNTVSWISDHFNLIKGAAIAIGAALGVGKAAEIANTFTEFFRNIKSLVVNTATVILNTGKIIGGAEGVKGAAETVAETAASGARLSPMITSIPAFWLAGGGILATELHRRYGILGKTPVEPGNVAGLPGAGISGGAARADVNELFKSSRQIAEEHRKAAEAVSKTASAANQAAPALSAIANASNAVQSSLNLLASKISSFQMPSVPGAAVPAGTPAPVKAHAAGGIFTRPHVGLVAERGPEAIIPLSNGAGITINSSPVIHAGPGTDTAGLSAMLREHARDIADQVLHILQVNAEQSAIV